MLIIIAPDARLAHYQTIRQTMRNYAPPRLD